ncbi:MAG TPA: GWxTD domain-containing protein [Thermoanaerobaculia bacterium]|nr:GWxTD domain-containing protein [Thermoanaerobaculia bacterium]
MTGALLLVAVLLTLPLEAQLSPKFADWARGPVRWLMTRDEQKTWKTIANDAEAQEFIDLFWARRDPTPGTYVNQFRLDFEARVKYADEHLGHTGSAGSNTDRGHALIVLGFPTNADRFDKSAPGSKPIQGSMTGEREVWTWEKDDARKFDRPRIEAVFVRDPVNGVVQRDTARNNIMSAFANAVEKAIVDRRMTVAPEWARSEPEPATSSQIVLARSAIFPKETKAVARGVHSLLLVKNAAALPDPQGGTDPIAAAHNADTFGKTDDLGYVFEYCGPSESLLVAISITGANGNMVAPAEEEPIEAIKAVPGCGIIRASIPLGDMQVAPGSYTFNVNLRDGSQSYNLSRDFKIE